MEGTLPGTETGPADGLRRPEAARKSEAGLRGILPREDTPPKEGMSPLEDSPVGGIPPRTEEIRPVLILSPTPVWLSVLQDSEQIPSQERRECQSLLLLKEQDKQDPFSG